MVSLGTSDIGVMGRGLRTASISVVYVLKASNVNKPSFMVSEK